MTNELFEICNFSNDINLEKLIINGRADLMDGDAWNLIFDKFL